MSSASGWAAGVAMAILALLGLFCASRAVDPMFAVFGGLLFGFGLAAIVAIVHQATAFVPTEEAPAATGGEDGLPADEPIAA